MKALSVEKVTKLYGKKEVLSSISLNIEEGQCLAIMGESGSGKSTLAKIIIELEKVSSGIVKIFGYDRETTNVNEQNFLRESMEILFQSSYQSLNPNMTVEDLIFEKNQVFGKNIDKKREIVLSLMREVELKENLIDRRISELSGGQLQRVCIARAISTYPKMIIFDESLSSLDPLTQDKILKLLVRLQKELSLTYIFISHDFELCYYLADKIVLIDKGEIIEEFSDLDGEIKTKTEKGRMILQVLNNKKCKPKL